MVQPFWGVYGHKKCVRDRITNVYYLPDGTKEYLNNHPELSEEREGFCRNGGAYLYRSAWKKMHPLVPREITVEYIEKTSAEVERRNEVFYARLLKKAQLDIEKEKRVEARLLRCEERHQRRQKFLDNCRPKIRETLELQNIPSGEIETTITNCCTASRTFPKLTDISRKSYEKAYIEECVAGCIKNIELEARRQQNKCQACRQARASKSCVFHCCGGCCRKNESACPASKHNKRARRVR